MILIHTLASLALAALGLSHIGFAVAAFDGWSAEAAWFVGAGLCLVVTGLFNLGLTRTSPVRAVVLCFVANLLGTAYAVGVSLAMPVPQAMAAVGLYAAVTIGVLGYLLPGPARR